MANEKINILIIDDLHPCFFERPGMQNFNITYLPAINAADVALVLANKQVLIVRSKVRVDKALCVNANKLQLVVRAGSGLDNLDIEWLDVSDIKYINTPEANSQAVAEHTLGMLLSLMANITKSDKEVKNYIWNREGNRGDELNGKTMGIIGFGNTGSRFAKILSGFEVKILAYDKYKSGFGNEQVKETDMAEIFEKADIVSLHIPLTSETLNLVNQDFINLFTKSIRLLNISRGGIVKIADVTNSLKTRKIIGFAADVLPNEQINKLTDAQQTEFDKLIEFKNVILTPHIGGWTHESYKKISMGMASKILEFYSKTSANPNSLKIEKITNL